MAEIIAPQPSSSVWVIVKGSQWWFEASPGEQLYYRKGSDPQRYEVTGAIIGPAPIAATTINDGSQLRVYILNQDNKVEEYCLDDLDSTSWFGGALTDKGYEAIPNGTLSAMDDPHKLIFQKTEGNISYGVAIASKDWELE